MPTEAKARNSKPWIIGFAVAIVVFVFILNAASGDGGVITSGAEYRETLAKAEKLSLAHLERLDKGEPLTAQGKNDLAEAAKMFDAMAEVQPTNIAPFTGAGKIYQALGQDEEAIRRFQQGLSTVPAMPIDAVRDTAIETHYLLSVSLFNIKDYSAALTAINNAIAMFPSSPIYLSHRARIYMETRKYEEAATDLVAALKIDPDHAQSKQLLKLIALSTLENLKESIKVKRNAKDFKGVVSEATKGLELEPQNLALLAYRAEANAMAGDLKAAQADLDRLRGLAPDSADVAASQRLLDSKT